MFDDLASVAQLIRKILILSGPPDGKSRSVYALFTKLEQVISNAEDVLQILSPLNDGLLCTEDSRERFFKLGDEYFRKLDTSAKQMVEWMSRLSLHRDTVQSGKRGEQALAISYHLHPKSHWYIHFQESFCSGRISEDKRHIEQIVLVVHPVPERRLLGIDLTAANLFRAIYLDCSTSAERLALITTSQSALRDLREIHDAVRAYIRSNYSIDDLLAPTPARGTP